MKLITSSSFHAVLIGIGALLLHQAFGEVSADGDRSEQVKHILRKEQEAAVLSPTIINDFKERNQLKDSFDPIDKLQDVTEESLTLGGTTISIRKEDLDPVESIFTADARFILNGEEQQNLPEATVFRSKSNPDFQVTMTADEGVLDALYTNPVTGETANFVRIGTGNNFLVEVRSEDLDQEKLSEFKLADAADRRQRSLRDVVEESSHATHHQRLLAPCSSYKIIEVAGK
jgi:hypothetical protein